MSERYVVYVDAGLGNSHYMGVNQTGNYYWLEACGYLCNESQIVHFDNIDKAKDALIKLLNDCTYDNIYQGSNICIWKVKCVVEFEDILYY